jgi:hypothetical protein
VTTLYPSKICTLLELAPAVLKSTPQLSPWLWHDSLSLHQPEASFDYASVWVMPALLLSSSASFLILGALRQLVSQHENGWTTVMDYLLGVCTGEVSWLHSSFCSMGYTPQPHFRGLTLEQSVSTDSKAFTLNFVLVCLLWATSHLMSRSRSYPLQLLGFSLCPSTISVYKYSYRISKTLRLIWSSFWGSGQQATFN